MANGYTIKVDVNGNITKIIPHVKSLNKELDNTASSHKRASAAADTHYHKMDKGIIGTANSSKSFSKLAQSIDGDNNSLVGAYAALAANIFAVSAAFLALKNAAETAQVIEGLAASGARLGLSYKNAIVEVRDAADGLLSLEQSARSTAQVLSAGFKTEQLVRLTNAAQDASFALGRDMGESMDRLTRGVIKLEPELLDELGIMVRLDEASATYARTLGKSTSQLTAAEKRQGFYNATIAEAEAKFGGLSNDANNAATALNKLNATFNDLTKTIFNIANIALGPIVKILGSSQGALLGGMLLFASSIKGQLIPGLVSMADSSAKAAEKARDLATQNIAADVASKKYLGRTDLSKEYFKSLSEGAYSAEKAQSVLAEAQGNYQVALLQGNRNNINGTKAELDTVTKSISTMSHASAIQSSSNAQTLASMGNYKMALKEVGNSIKQYSAGANVAALNTGLMGKAGALASTSMFALGVATKTAGVAFLNLLPWIGLIVAALSGAWSIIKMIAGDGYAKLTAATKAYNEVMKTSKDSLEQYNKLNESTASAFTRVSSRATIASNSIVGMAESLKALQEAQANNSGFGNFIQGIADYINIGRTLDIGNIVKRNQEKGGNLGTEEVANNYELIKTFEQMSKYESAQGIIKGIFGPDGPKTIEEISSGVKTLYKDFKSLASVIEEVQSAFKALDLAAADFIKAATPSTPYDAMTAGLQSSTSALSKYISEVGKGTQSTSDLADILSGIGPSAGQFLSVEASDALKTYREISTEIQGIKILGDKATESDKARLSVLTKELNGMKPKSILVLKELDAQREIFEIEQNKSIEQQGQLALAQARLSVVNKSTAITRAESDAKVEAENAVIGLQIAQIRGQAAILRSLLDQNIEKQKQLDLMKKEIGLGDILNEQAKVRANEAMILALANLPDFFGSKAVIDSLIKQNEELNKSIDLKRQNKNLTAAVNSLNAQASALAMTLIGEEEKRLLGVIKDQEKALHNTKTNIQLLSSQLDLQKAFGEQSNVLFGYSNNQLEIDEKTYELARNRAQELRDESAVRVAQYELEKERSTRAENAAEWQERITNETTKLLPALVAQADAETTLAYYKFLRIQSTEEIMNKELSLLRILEQQLAINTKSADQAIKEIKAKTAATLQGRELTPTEQRNLAVEAAQIEYDNAVAIRDVKLSIIDAEYGLLNYQMVIAKQQAVESLNRQEQERGQEFFTKDPVALQRLDASIAANRESIAAYDTILNTLDNSQESARALINKEIERLQALLDQAKTTTGLSGGAFAPSASMASLASQPSGLMDQDGQPILGKGIGFNKETLSAMHEDIQPFITELKKLGPEGEYVSAVAQGALVMADAIGRIGKSGLDSADGLAAVGSIIGEIAKIASAGADAKIASIDREIAAEQKRDGKSAESVAKIKAMEAKKEATAKKAFEVNKKLQMAQTVVNTASAIVGALANPGGLPGMILAAMYGALGAAQLSVIAGTSYQGGASSAASAATPSALSVGTRSSSVDLAKSNTTVGGEHGYLTGAQGQGTNASNFKPRAYGGYGNAGMIVGEKGPELFVPSTPGTVVSNDNMTQAAPINANISINAIDAEGVERVLTDQRGHIIGMLREAANANGQNFLENVDTIKYRRTGGRRL
jgi:hypothetical protein